MWTIAFDPERMICGCAIVQAAMGGTVPTDRIDALPWAAAPTPGMRLYAITDEQLEQLRGMCARDHVVYDHPRPRAGDEDEPTQDDIAHTH